MFIIINFIHTSRVKEKIFKVYKNKEASEDGENNSKKNSTNKKILKKSIH